MIVKIDISVNSADGAAVGMADGELDFAAIPQIGATVSLSRPLRDGIALAPPFGGHLRVENVIYVPSSGGARIIVMLEDIVADNVDHANDILAYLEQGFGLLATTFDTSDS